MLNKVGIVLIFPPFNFVVLFSLQNSPNKVIQTRMWNMHWLIHYSLRMCNLCIGY